MINKLTYFGIAVIFSLEVWLLCIISQYDRIYMFILEIQLKNWRNFCYNLILLVINLFIHFYSL